METLSWGRLESHIQTGRPALLPMGGTRFVQVGYDPRQTRIFLRIPLEHDAPIPPSPFAELNLEARQVGAEMVLEVSTSADHLFKEFHRLAGLMTEEYERRGQTAIGAFSTVVDRWRELTTVRRLLSSEEQLGLIGELVVLEGLRREHGSKVISSWTGRMVEWSERHDFRIGKIDLEVKSTRMSKRQHVIHGLRQLEPSLGYELYLISLRFEAAGFESGTNLGDRIRAMRSALSADPEAVEEFNLKLAATRYSDSDEAHYQERYILADPPILIPVDEKCPRLILSTVLAALGVDQANRIDNDVIYRIDVEGLGEKLVLSEHAKKFGLKTLE